MTNYVITGDCRRAGHCLYWSFSSHPNHQWRSNCQGSFTARQSSAKTAGRQTLCQLQYNVSNRWVIYRSHLHLYCEQQMPRPSLLNRTTMLVLCHISCQDHSDDNPRSAFIDWKIKCDGLLVWPGLGGHDIWAKRAIPLTKETSHYTGELVLYFLVYLSCFLIGNRYIGQQLCKSWHHQRIGVGWCCYTT